MKLPAPTPRGGAATALSAAAALLFAVRPGTTQPSTLAADHYLEEIGRQRDAVTSYRGTANLRVYGEVEGSYNAAFGRVLPDRSRLEISAPLTGTALVVTARAGRLLAYYPRDKVAVVEADRGRGPAGFPAGETYGGLSESLDWLAGRPPLYSTEIAAGNVEMAAAEDAAYVTLTWRTPGGTRLQQFTLARDPLRVVGARLYENDEAAFDVTYGDWRDRGGFPAPFAVTVKTAETVIEITVTKFEVNVGITEEAFSTVPPDGTTLLEGWPAGSAYDAEN